MNNSDSTIGQINKMNMATDPSHIKSSDVFSLPCISLYTTPASWPVGSMWCTWQRRGYLSFQNRSRRVQWLTSVTKLNYIVRITQRMKDTTTYLAFVIVGKSIWSTYIGSNWRKPCSPAVDTVYAVWSTAVHAFVPWENPRFAKRSNMPL